MKKLYTAVFLVVLAGVGSANVAQAGITGSAHDLTSNVLLGGQICIPCHAPHKGTVVPGAPLWNHKTTVATYDLYSSPTFNGSSTITQPTGVSKLCLSCHDGTVAIDAFGTVNGTTMIGVSKVIPGLVGLKNDHPVSFVYDAALASADGGLVNPTTGDLAQWVPQGRFECSSCHDVHNKNGITKLLRMANNGSALCLKCHTK